MIEIVRPATIPEPGPKTAQAILDIIRLVPERHEQSSWQGTNNEAIERTELGQAETCGTTRCVGGWAVWLHDGTLSLNGGECVCASCSPDLRRRAAQCLGLHHATANKLFYDTSNEQAVKALEMIAEGRPIDWDEVYGRVPVAA